jgi:ketosteroid isomerase-like protein
MKTLLVLITIIALTCFVTSCSSNEPPPAAAPSAASSGGEENVEQVLAKLSDEWGQVPLKKDASPLERIWAPDYSYIEADGSVINKQEGIAAVSKNTDTHTSAVVSNFKVRVFGKDFAVASGDYTDEGRDKSGKEFRRKSRFTNVWAKQNGAWQCVAGHSSDLK